MTCPNAWRRLLAALGLLLCSLGPAAAQAAEPLVAERLAAGDRPTPAQWQRLGAAIRRLHAAGVDHVDLNAHNLLVGDDGRVWIIDFDRCRRRGGQGWQAGNLARLQRSLRKLARLQPGFAYDEADWPALTAGYARGG